MGLRDALQAIQGYPTARAELETVRFELRQARQALEQSTQEQDSLRLTLEEQREYTKFLSGKAEALQKVLTEFCPKLSTQEEMKRLYNAISPSLDVSGFTLYRMAKELTEGDVPPGFPYFEEKLYRKVLERMGFGALLAPEEIVRSHEPEVIPVEEKTTELKLYSPLSAELYEEDCGDPQTLTGRDLTGFQDVIRQGIEDERLPDEEARGLMACFDGSEAVDEKVASVSIDVEEAGGELFGVAVCKIRGSLTPGELEELKEFCTGQYSDGWGEGFEQRPRRTDYGSLYVSFWSSDGFFLRTREELETAKIPARSKPRRGDHAR